MQPIQIVSGVFTKGILDNVGNVALEKIRSNDSSGVILVWRLGMYPNAFMAVYQAGKV